MHVSGESLLRQRAQRARWPWGTRSLGIFGNSKETHVWEQNYLVREQERDKGGGGGPGQIT